MVLEESCGTGTMAASCARSVSRMLNKHRGKYCAKCKKQRNLAWDPAHKVCYDCMKR